MVCNSNLASTSDRKTDAVATITRAFVFIIAGGCWCAAAESISAEWVPGTTLHPMPAPRAEIVAGCQLVSEKEREHVHIFLVNGLDPTNICNFIGQRDYFVSLGATRNGYFLGRCGMTCPGSWRGIRDVRRTDPEAPA